MAEQITIQAPNAPATGKQWGLIRHLAHEAGFKTATEAVVDVLGSYTKGAFTRELASAVITTLKTRDDSEAENEPANRTAYQAFREGWAAAFKTTPQIDPLPGMAPMGLLDPTADTAEPELDLAAKAEPTVAVQCAHWGTLQVREVAADPRYPDEIEHEIACSCCGAQWAQVEAGNPTTIQ